MSAAQDFLSRLQIASPCPASWAEMSGDERARFCASCEKHVYDFSRMTAEEGLALIREKEGNVCARLWRRADGTLITADCPVGVRWARDRRSMRLPHAAAGLLAIGLLSFMAGCAAYRSPGTEAGAVRPAGAVSGQKPKEDTDAKIVVVGMVTSSPIDTTDATQGMRLSREDWERLPLP